MLCNFSFFPVNGKSNETNRAMNNLTEIHQQLIELRDSLTKTEEENARLRKIIELGNETRHRRSHSSEIQDNNNCGSLIDLRLKERMTLLQRKLSILNRQKRELRSELILRRCFSTQSINTTSQVHKLIGKMGSVKHGLESITKQIELDL
ncbi:hypothetical protein ACOME3_007957 [Neoechinorhynchus agilis]